MVLIARWLGGKPSPIRKKKIFFNIFFVDAFCKKNVQ